jgi:hypoxanthine phosphoribosyltransferase
MNKNIKLLDKEFEPYIYEEELQKRIHEISQEVNKLYKNKRPVFIPVLNGSFFFASDLLKGVNIECEVSFIKLKSYSGTHSTGVVSELIGFDNDIRGRDIIILEDIVDTGRTLKRFWRN